MISRSGICEIHPANCQMTAADVAAIAMIRNNAVWIHGLIKTLSSKLNGQNWPFLRLRSRNDRPRAARPGAHPEKTCQQLSMWLVPRCRRKAYVNLIATGIVFNIRASSSHIGLMKAFSEHRRWIISVFDRRSIMNLLYWHNQQVGYLCFIPFVWEQRGVIAAVADQTAMISHLLPMCWATRGWPWGYVGAVWEPRIDRVKLAFAL